MDPVCQHCGRIEIKEADAAHLRSLSESLLDDLIAHPDLCFRLVSDQGLIDCEYYAEEQEEDEDGLL